MYKRQLCSRGLTTEQVRKLWSTTARPLSDEEAVKLKNAFNLRLGKTIDNYIIDGYLQRNSLQESSRDLFVCVHHLSPLSNLLRKGIPLTEEMKTVLLEKANSQDDNDFPNAVAELLNKNDRWQKMERNMEPTTVDIYRVR